MTPATIRAARDEARAFIRAADAALSTVERRKTDAGAPYETMDTGKITGTLRRRSMDLTRSLADLRRFTP